MQLELEAKALEKDMEYNKDDTGIVNETHLRNNKC